VPDAHQRGYGLVAASISFKPSRRPGIAKVAPGGQLLGCSDRQIGVSQERILEVPHASSATLLATVMNAVNV
jgi:hypothetical protein